MRFIFPSILLVCAWTLGAAEEGARDPAEIQAAMAQMSTTGPEHVALMRTVGDWTVASTMWMEPGAAPAKSTGTASIVPILDGKWIRQDFSGDMMGEPFSGLLVSGYDTLAEQYVAVWFDSFSTGLSKLTGQSEDGGKTIIYHSRLEHCPLTGGPLDQRYVVRIESDDRFVMEAYHQFEGAEEAKVMELVYTRVQPGGQAAPEPGEDAAAPVRPELQPTERIPEGEQQLAE